VASPYIERILKARVYDVAVETPLDEAGRLSRRLNNQVLLKREVMKKCLAAFVGSPFHIGIPLAFLVMSDLEVQDLIVLIEAKSSNLPDDEYRPFLLKTNFLN